MHPEASLSCVDCHGGNAAEVSKLEAHVRPPSTPVDDERVEPLDRHLAWRRFRNPMDLRIVDRTCGTCHRSEVERLLASLHGTTAGHLSDGYYEVGLSPKRGSLYGVFPVTRAPTSGGEIEKLVQVPAFRDELPSSELSSHYTDLARKECLQCHLWSEGRAVRGRVGFDGDYRGDGCAACHVPYALDGLSESADSQARRSEPGHPRRHAMTRAPTTEACTACHYGDASIGLHFRGLSQLPPNAPGGPDIPGTTATQLNRVFYLNDPEICPPDIHHERGMHCIDCHTAGDVMGDGKLHGQMEYAVEISCQACHGTFAEPSTLRTERGTPLEHLTWDGEELVLTSKVDGQRHVVPQAIHVLDPDRPEYNPRAARAMTDEHSNIECYTCHAGWNANFLGFHFSRQEALSQLDLLSGKRTSGRVTTQEKVFATWKSFYAGLNERGAVAPYLTGFSTMGSVWNAAGELVLDQVMPVTAEGLSGMTMIHHQPHSTRPTARSCVECHRSSATWGLGTANFRLARQLAFVADRRGIEVVAIQRAEPAHSIPLLKYPLPDVVELAIHADPLQGYAHHLYAAEGGHGIHVLDVSNPLEPRTVAFVATVNPRGIELVGDTLYVADGIAGVKVFDVSKPAAIRQIGRFVTVNAHDVDVKWPWMYVADGAGGLVLADVTVPIAPRFLAGLDLNGATAAANQAILVETLFQYSRPVANEGGQQHRRSSARNLCAVLDRRRGAFFVDVTEPTRPVVLHPEASNSSNAGPLPGVDFRGLVLLSQVDLAEAQGGERTAERDYAYVLFERGPLNDRRSGIRILDVSDPKRIPRFGTDRQRVPAGYATEQLVAADFYNPPFRQRLLFSPGELGVYITDVSTSREPVQIGLLPGLDEAFALAIEEFPLDRMVDEAGRPLKDVSHADSRWLQRGEIERILSVSAAALGFENEGSGPEPPAWTARLLLERADVDHSGFLEGEEYEAGGGRSVDQDGDGRITLAELGQQIEPQEEETVEESTATSAAAAAPSASRTLEDGDLARILDGTNPFLFDDNDDSRLDRGEAARAFFAALDLDEDERLTLDELSRYPGQLRDLRFADVAAKATFRALDRNGDEKLVVREFLLGEPEWTALDADRDNAVRLLRGEFDFQRERGFVLDGSEWPKRRSLLFPLPPGITSDQLLARFDADRDGVLGRAEMTARPELFAMADLNRDATVDRVEIVRIADLIGKGGVDTCADDFWGRWDLDANGRLESGELPELVFLRLRNHLPKK